MKMMMISTVAVLFAGTAMAMDSNADGHVSADEFMAAEERNATFEAWDGDKDGMLSADEWATGNWKMFDQDGDNMWNETETGFWSEAATRAGRQVSQ